MFLIWKEVSPSIYSYVIYIVYIVTQECCQLNVPQVTWNKRLAEWPHHTPNAPHVLFRRATRVNRHERLPSASSTPNS